METIIYEYRQSLPSYKDNKYQNKQIEGKAAYILAKALFGDKMDNHISIIIDNIAYHWSDNVLYIDCDKLLAGDCNKTAKCLEVIWQKG